MRAVGRKPLSVIQSPRESSQAAMGRASSAAWWEIWSKAPKTAAIAEPIRIGAPMRPIVGMMRGTRPDLYMIIASSTALTAGTSPGPSRNNQSCSSVIDLPAAPSATFWSPAPSVAAS